MFVFSGYSHLTLLDKAFNCMSDSFLVEMDHAMFRGSIDSFVSNIVKTDLHI